MKGRDLTTKKMIQTDHTVLGTGGYCILKSIAFDFNKTVPYNFQQQTCIHLNVSLHFLIRIQDQDRFSFFGVGNFITDHPVCGPLGPQIQIGSPFWKKFIRMPSFFLFIM